MNCFDIIGPIMIGPSSSHTAGAARIGKIAGTLLGEPAVSAEITLSGSFAETYRGHGTDKALVAGIMGMSPDDTRLRDSLNLAKKEGLEVKFICRNLDDTHPNTAVIDLVAKSGKTISIQGASVGGGNILITKINGLSVEINGQYTVLVVIHKDKPGTIAAVTHYMAGLGLNICNFRLAREQKGGTAVMTIEIDGAINESVSSEVASLANVMSCTLLPVNG